MVCPAVGNCESWGLSSPGELNNGNANNESLQINVHRIYPDFSIQILSYFFFYINCFSSLTQKLHNFIVRVPEQCSDNGVNLSEVTFQVVSQGNHSSQCPRQLNNIGEISYFSISHKQVDCSTALQMGEVKREETMWRKKMKKKTTRYERLTDRSSNGLE